MTAIAAALLTVGAVFAVESPALAQDGDDEIEIDPDDGGGDEIEIEAEDAQGDLEADTASMGDGDDGPVKASDKLTDNRVSWQDIVVVIRKPFLKVGRWEVQPQMSTTMNDNMIRHVGAGAQINYYLTDVLAIGIEGQYFTKQFREPFDLVARQARRLPTINKYNFAAAFNFHYVPVYGKFAIFDKKIVTWETYFTAGLGITQSEVIPRDPRFGAFTNLLITPNIGASMRFFIFKWMTVNLSVRDYLFVDTFEPVGRSETMFASPDAAKENGDSAFINNVMFQLGVSFWLPPTFEYTTFR